MNINIPKEPLFIINTLEEKGFKGYLVGGCVRDSVMGLQANDYDIASDALPETVVDIFRSLGYTVVETGLKHGTVTIVMGSDKLSHYEVTTFREDVYNPDGELDHRHPEDVQFSKDILVDLSRRDFTINAMAVDKFGNLLDPHNGLQDIKNGIIRCVGDPFERFKEDALRMLRAIRFTCRFNFEIDSKTWVAMLKLSDTLQYISKERIRDEFCKTIMTDYASCGLLIFKSSNMLKYIIPEIIPCIGFEQFNIHHDKNVFDHILSVVDNCPKILNVRLAAVLHDIGKPACFEMDENGQGHFYSHHKISSKMTDEILYNLKFDKNTIKKVSILVREHMSRYDKLRVASIKRFINRVGIENLNDLFDLQTADIKGSAPEYHDFSGIELLKNECTRIINEKQPLGLKDININGHDLIQFGYKPGKEIGIKLKEILDLVLDDKIINEKVVLIEYLKNN